MTKRCSTITRPASSPSSTPPPVNAPRSAARRYSSPRRPRPTVSSSWSRRATRPYSWLVPYQNFAASIEVWNRQGAPVKPIAQLPVADNVPNGGVMPGPRNFQWQPLAPATVVWAEALDNGDPKTKVPHRDKVVAMSAPFTAAPSEIARTEYRVGNVSWTDSGAVLLTENDRDTAVDPHLGDRPAGRGAAQTVGPQPGRFLRQSWHAAAARARVGRSRPSSRTPTRSSSPAPVPRRKARGRSSIASTSPRSRASACSRPPGAHTRR